MAPGGAAAIFAGVEAQWCVAGGCALDLFLGDREQRRRWLAGMLARVQPGHRWLSDLPTT